MPYTCHTCSPPQACTINLFTAVNPLLCSKRHFHLSLLFKAWVLLSPTQSNNSNNCNCLLYYGNDYSCKKFCSVSIWLDPQLNQWQSHQRCSSSEHCWHCSKKIYGGLLTLQCFRLERLSVPATSSLGPVRAKLECFSKPAKVTVKKTLAYCIICPFSLNYESVRV